MPQSQNAPFKETFVPNAHKNGRRSQKIFHSKNHGRSCMEKTQMIRGIVDCTLAFKKNKKTNATKEQV